MAGIQTWAPHLFELAEIIAAESLSLLSGLQRCRTYYCHNGLQPQAQNSHLLHFYYISDSSNFILPSLRLSTVCVCVCVSSRLTDPAVFFFLTLSSQLSQIFLSLHQLSSSLIVPEFISAPPPVSLSLPPFCHPSISYKVRCDVDDSKLLTAAGDCRYTTKKKKAAEIPL